MSEIVKGLLLESRPTWLDPAWTMAITILAAIALIGEAISGFSRVRDLLLRWKLLKPLRLISVAAIVIVVLAAFHQFRNVAEATEVAEHKAHESLSEGLRRSFTLSWNHGPAFCE